MRCALAICVVLSLPADANGGVLVDVRNSNCRMMMAQTGVDGHRLLTPEAAAFFEGFNYAMSILAELSDDRPFRIYSEICRDDPSLSVDDVFDLIIVRRDRAAREETTIPPASWLLPPAQSGSD